MGKRAGEGTSRSYSSQACFVRRITFNELRSCSFRCSSTAGKNLKQLETHDRLVQRVLHFKKMIKNPHLQTHTDSHIHTHTRTHTLANRTLSLPTNIHFLETKLVLKTSFPRRWEEKGEGGGARNWSLLPPQGSGAECPVVGGPTVLAASSAAGRGESEPAVGPSASEIPSST